MATQKIFESTGLKYVKQGPAFSARGHFRASPGQDGVCIVPVRVLCKTPRSLVNHEKEETL